jgi:hypothetical protein
MNPQVAFNEGWEAYVMGEYGIEDNPYSGWETEYELELWQSWTEGWREAGQAEIELPIWADWANG